MASNHQAIIFTGNTYPKWTRVPPQFFDHFYEPTEQLKSLFPWPNEDLPPEVVVHLRKEDGKRDVRRGLDDETLNSLGTQLSAPENQFGSKPYLVTNYGLLADQMEQSFGWTGPHWNVQVKHSAMSVAWDSAQNSNTTNDKNDVRAQIPEKKLQTMMGWIDWFAIAKAKQVHHTVSDFSSSAIHWMGSDEYVESHIIWGTDAQTGELIEQDEAWVDALKSEGTYPIPLVDRPENTLTDWRGKLCKGANVIQSRNVAKGDTDRNAKWKTIKRRAKPHVVDHRKRNIHLKQ
eukprot:scaffold170191_cov54-Attheya_sp.AAC.1